MKSLIVAFVLLGSSAFAAGPNYDLKMELSLEGKHVLSPKVIVPAGETASVDDGKTFVEVVANEGAIQDHKGILMKLTVGTIGKDGKRKILATPQVLAKENQAAQVTVESANGGPADLSLSIVAKRIK
ncbi:hypothetical protein [Bdellovibrio sp. HCB2-146]|uniref:hypothetical protein n=1 Tax=Bdellovibrio sp. HCB2-146 TaxID=3394362 RepID=UPI0039BD6CB9